jgi:hypothetical protein
MRTQLIDNIVTPLTESGKRQIERGGPIVHTRLIIEVALKLEFEADGDTSLAGGCIALRAYRF